MFGKNDNSNSKKSKKKNGNLFGAACLLLGLLIILIAFLVKKDQIKTNLKETAFFERVFGNTPTFIQNENSQTKVKTEKNEDKITFNIQDSDDDTGDGSAADVEKKPEAEEKSITLKQLKENLNSSREKSEENDAVVLKTQKEEKTPEKAEAPVKAEKVTEAVESQKTDVSGKKSESQIQSEAKKAPVVPKITGTTDLQLCFTVIDADGSVSRKIIKRTVQKNDSPLTTAINLLLAGPDFSKSEERNLTSFIPKGTKLLGARVSNGVAVLNFNDNLEYNGEGSVGMINSLMQIVYTATSFSTVSSVQFLIEGEKKTYLGEEGIEIGSPLSKINF